MPAKHKNNDVYATLSLKDFTLNIFTTKKQVADIVGCNRNTLIDIPNKITIGDYVIFTTTVTKCNRGRR